LHVQPDQLNTLACGEVITADTKILWEIKLLSSKKASRNSLPEKGRTSPSARYDGLRLPLVDNDNCSKSRSWRQKILTEK
jgi:hypothetical protein